MLLPELPGEAASGLGSAFVTVEQMLIAAQFAGRDLGLGSMQTGQQPCPQSGKAKGRPRKSERIAAVVSGRQFHAHPASLQSLTRELMFDDVRVPLDHLVGERGGGYRQFLQILEGGRVAIAALSVGVAQACLDASLAYSSALRSV